MSPPYEAHHVDVRPGEWCDTCALPSVVEVDVNVVDRATLDTIERCTVRVCTDCGPLELRHRT